MENLSDATATVAKCGGPPHLLLKMDITDTFVAASKCHVHVTCCTAQ